MSYSTLYVLGTAVGDGAPRADAFEMRRNGPFSRLRHIRLGPLCPAEVEAACTRQ